jgi:hypothetical protein
MKKALFFAFFILLMTVSGLYARGSGEVKRFVYMENGIAKNVSAEYFGVQEKAMYIKGSGNSAKIVIEVSTRPWNGDWGDWYIFQDMSYPFADENTLLLVASEIEEIIIAEENGKRYVFELMIPADKGDYFWWNDNELHFMQKCYQIK